MLTSQEEQRDRISFECARALFALLHHIGTLPNTCSYVNLLVLAGCLRRVVTATSERRREASYCTYQWCCVGSRNSWNHPKLCSYHIIQCGFRHEQPRTGDAFKRKRLGEAVAKGSTTAALALESQGTASPLSNSHTRFARSPDAFLRAGRSFETGATSIVTCLGSSGCFCRPGACPPAHWFKHSPIESVRHSPDEGKLASCACSLLTCQSPLPKTQSGLLAPSSNAACGPQI